MAPPTKSGTLRGRPKLLSQTNTSPTSTTAPANPMAVEMESEGPGQGRGGRDVDGGIERVKKEVSDNCDEIQRNEETTGSTEVDSSHYCTLFFFFDKQNSSAAHV